MPGKMLHPGGLNGAYSVLFSTVRGIFNIKNSESHSTLVLTV
jgi:hypothetical protein